MKIHTVHYIGGDDNGMILGFTNKREAQISFNKLKKEEGVQLLGDEPDEQCFDISGSGLIEALEYGASLVHK